MQNKKWPVLILVFLGCAGWLAANSIKESATRRFPVYDEVSYLDQARTFADAGVFKTLDTYIDGTNLDDNRHPLYSFLLSRFMDKSPHDFTRGKLFACVQMVMLLTLIMFFTRKLWGESESIVAGLLFAFSSASVHLSQIILADVLFTIFYAWTCFRLAKHTDSKRAWAATGILCGLAYITKGNGYLLLGIAAVMGARFGLLSGFFLCSGLLLWRNIVVWGNPFHHINNKVIWLNGWEEHFFYKMTPTWNEIGMRWYFKNHSITQALTRFSEGAWRQLKLLFESLAFVSFENKLRFAIGIIIFGLAIYGMRLCWRSNRKREVIVVSLGILAIFLPFSFFVDQTVRYMFPITTLLIPFAAIGIVKLIPFKTKALPHVAMAFAVSGCVALVHAARKHPPNSLYEVPAYWMETTDWIEENLGNEKLMIDTWSPYSEWHCCADRRLGARYSVPTELLQGFIAFNNVRFAMVDAVQTNRETDRSKFGASDEHGPKTFLGWTRRFHDSGKPSHFLIYERPR